MVKFDKLLPGRIPSEEFVKEQFDGSDFWVLQRPDTLDTIMMQQGELHGPITFDTEEKALEFAVQYNVPVDFKPVLQKSTKQ